MESLLSNLAVGVAAILICYVQLSFWFPSSRRNVQTMTMKTRKEYEASDRSIKKTIDESDSTSINVSSSGNDGMTQSITSSTQLTNNISNGTRRTDNNKDDGSVETVRASTTTNSNQWRCACEGGFLPPGMFGGVEAVMRMGTGQCYHKQM